MLFHCKVDCFSTTLCLLRKWELFSTEFSFPKLLILLYFLYRWSITVKKKSCADSGAFPVFSDCDSKFFFFLPLLPPHPTPCLWFWFTSVSLNGLNWENQSFHFTYKLLLFYASSCLDQICGFVNLYVFEMKFSTIFFFCLQFWAFFVCAHVSLNFVVANISCSLH